MHIRDRNRFGFSAPAIRLALGLLIGLTLVGCGGRASGPAEPPTPTEAPADVVVPTPLPTATTDAGASKGDLRPVTLAMGFIPNVQFTPVYVAVERGYFAQEGIAPELDYGWDTDLLKLVGANELSFVIGSGDQVILARSQGLPVVYVMNWYRRFPVAVASLEPLDNAQDLIGKTIGTPVMFGASYIGWRALADGAGIPQAEVELVTIGYTQVESLVTGQVDAAVVYAMNTPVQLRSQGYEVSVLLAADYANLVSNGLVTNETTIAQEPELVAGMVRAMLRGLQDTIDDPAAAFAICRRHVPEIDDEGAPLQRAVLDESLLFWQPEAGAVLGQSDPAAWETSQKVMHEIGLIDAEMETSELFSNDFVPTP
jgi:NitT/TauT family transport system substrate-binding protein